MRSIRARLRSLAVLPLLLLGVTCKNADIGVTIPNAVTGVTVSPALTVQAGSDGLMTASVTTTGTIGRDVTWSSSNVTIATVAKISDSQARITGMAPGAATIIATSVADSKVSGSNTVTVTALPDACTAITIDPRNGTISVGQTLQVTAQAQRAVGSVNVAYNYVTSNASVASINASGLVTALSPGTATMTVTAACTGAGHANTVLNDQVAITVSALDALKGLTVSPAVVTLLPAEVRQLTPQPDKATPAVAMAYTYVSSNLAVATVNTSGMVAGVAPGTATITVTGTGTLAGYTTTAKVATVNVTVTTAGAACTAATLTPGANTIVQGNTATYAGAATKAGVNVAVTGTYTTSAPAIATVNSSGVALGVAPGTATITYTGTCTGVGFNNATVTANATLTVLASGGNATLRVTVNSPVAAARYLFVVDSGAYALNAVGVEAVAPAPNSRTIVTDITVPAGANYRVRVLIADSAGAYVTQFNPQVGAGGRARGIPGSGGSVTPVTINATRISITSLTIPASVPIGSKAGVRWTIYDPSNRLNSLLSNCAGIWYASAPLTADSYIIGDGVNVTPCATMTIDNDSTFSFVDSVPSPPSARVIYLQTDTRWYIPSTNSAPSYWSPSVQRSDASRTINFTTSLRAGPVRLRSGAPPRTSDVPQPNRSRLRDLPRIDAPQLSHLVITRP